MQKLFYATFYGKKAPKKRFETNTEPSMTVQGDSMTIAELLKRELNGMQAPRKNVVYMDGIDLDKINRFYQPAQDLTDLQEIRENHQQLLLQIEQAVHQAEKQKKEADETDVRIQKQKDKNLKQEEDGSDNS